MPAFPIALTARESQRPRPVPRTVDRRWPVTATGDLRPLPVLVVVVVTRALIAWEWVAIQSLGLGDVQYYWARITTLGEVGLASTMREYPTPMVWLLSVPEWLGGGSLWGYAGWFVALVLLTDLAFCALIWSTRAGWRGWAIVVWSVLCATLGPLVWLRFDLVPAVIVGAALVLAAQRPATAGELLAVGAGTKLWPAVLFPLLLNRPDGVRHRDWMSATVGFGVTGAVIVVASLIAGGWTRLLSPLVWQSDRGLQIESVPATIPMVGRAIDSGTWQVQMSHFQAFEVFGPGIDQWLAVADVLAVLGVGLGLAVLVRHWRRAYSGRADWATGAAVAALAIICLLIVTNKTLSPQYVVWLAGPVAALVAGQQAGVLARNIPIGRWVLWLFATAATTHVVFPVLYDRLNGMVDDPVGTAWATVALVARNVVLIGFTADVLGQALRSGSPEPAKSRMR